MTTDESALPGLIQQMVNDIKDPKCGYWLYSNYFDVQPPTERRITRWWQAPLYIDYDALWNPQLGSFAKTYIIRHLDTKVKATPFRVAYDSVLHSTY
jgi:hypothetical protein